LLPFYCNYMNFLYTMCHNMLICTYKAEMTERPKRNISKPSRYLTTSSDEAPPKQRRIATTNNAANVQEDIQNIRRTLEEEPTYFYNNNNYYYNITEDSHTYTYIPSQTNILSDVAAPYQIQIFNHSVNKIHSFNHTQTMKHIH